MKYGFLSQKRHWEISPARRAGFVVRKMKRPEGTMESGVHSGRMDLFGGLSSHFVAG
jgi:hypothetical protein